MFPLIVFTLALFVYFTYPFTNHYPMGYAGLYNEISDAILENSFFLPMRIPYYGPNGIPFAYPPLAFYLEALITKLANMSVLNPCYVTGM
jgi:hypothetical protein